MSVTILDGGMGQELLKRSAAPPSEMWSARVLMDEPEIVTATHLDFIEAGADVITINAYAASPERLARFGVPEMFEPFQARAIDCAKRARDASGRDVQITGCLPPLFSSYNPGLNTDLGFATDTYAQIVAAQAEGVDILLAETLGSILEVRSALAAMMEQGKPVWISVTVSDEAPTNLRSGERLANAVSLADSEGVNAMLVNCSTPETLAKALPIIASETRSFGAYANGFTRVPKLVPGDVVAETISIREDLSAERYADFAAEWVGQGATLIGGCCEVGPAHIAALSHRFGGKT